MTKRQQNKKADLLKGQIRPENITRWINEQGECRVTKIYKLTGIVEFRSRLATMGNGDFLMLQIKAEPVWKHIRIDKINGRYKMSSGVGARINIADNINMLLMVLDGYVKAELEYE